MCLTWIAFKVRSQGFFGHLVGGVEFALEEADAVDFFAVHLFAALVRDPDHARGCEFYQVLQQSLVVDIYENWNFLL